MCALAAPSRTACTPPSAPSWSSTTSSVQTQVQELESPHRTRAFPLSTGLLLHENYRAVMRAVLRHVATAYESALEARPIVTKGITGWALAFTGDNAAQALERRDDGRWHQHGEPWDVRRTIAFSTHNGLWSAFGLHPILNHVERMVPGASLRAVVTKTAMQLAVMDPLLYLPSVYVGNGLLLGDDFAAILAKAQAEFLPTTVWMWKFWSPVTVIQFRFVPVRHQANFINAVDAAWLVLLSVLYNAEQTSVGAGR